MQLFSAGLTKPSLNGIKKAMKCFVNNYPSQNLYFVLFRIGKELCWPVLKTDSLAQSLKNPQGKISGCCRRFYLIAAFRTTNS